jgi:hypothetical protein
MRTIAIVVALAVGPVITAQDQNVAIPVRQRIITDARFTLKAPPHPCAVPSIVLFLASNVGAVSGTEYDVVTEPCSWDLPGPKPLEEVPLQGKTIEEALNLFVEIDPRYQWQERDGVIMMRPVRAWRDPKHHLHGPLQPIEFENRTMSGAMRWLRPIVGGTTRLDVPDLAMQTPQGWYEFSVKLPPVSALEALNAVAKAHGNLHWEIKYCKPEARTEFAELMLWTTDRSGLGTKARACQPRSQP